MPSILFIRQLTPLIDEVNRLYSSSLSVRLLTQIRSRWCIEVPVVTVFMAKDHFFPLDYKRNTKTVSVGGNSSGINHQLQ